MSLSGRTQTRPGRRERNKAKSARGAPAIVLHAPLQPPVRDALQKCIDDIRKLGVRKEFVWPKSQLRNDVRHPLSLLPAKEPGRSKR